MPKLPQHIEESFDTLFNSLGYDHVDTCTCGFMEDCKCISGRDKLKSFLATILEEERERIIGEIKKFKIMECSVIDKLEEKSEREKVTNLLNENLEIGYRQACIDIINLIKEDK